MPSFFTSIIAFNYSIKTIKAIKFCNKSNSMAQISSCTKSTSCFFSS